MLGISSISFSISLCDLTVSPFCVLFSASRAKLSMVNTVSKIRGQVKSPGYPQAEGVLGECMVRYGREMGEDTNFGVCVYVYV